MFSYSNKLVLKYILTIFEIWILTFQKLKFWLHEAYLRLKLRLFNFIIEISLINRKVMYFKFYSKSLVPKWLQSPICCHRTDIVKYVDLQYLNIYHFCENIYIYNSLTWLPNSTIFLISCWQHSVCLHFVNSYALLLSITLRFCKKSKFIAFVVKNATQKLTAA